MRIALDLRIYGPKYGGLGRYNQELLAHLIKFDQNNNYIVLVKNPADLPNLPANFTAQECDCHWYSLSEQIKLPKILAKIRPDLVHFPHFNVPYFYRGKFIVTIHDLIMTKFPSQRASTLNKFKFMLKFWSYKLIIKKAVKQSQTIITVSKFSAEDIKSYFKLTATEAEKIKVIYEGVSLPEITQPQEVKLPAKFLLYVGNAYPHKGLEFLIKGFAEFIKQHPDYYLILIGDRNYFYQRLEKYAVEILGSNKDKVIFPGFTSDEKLISYYNKATAYVFPSQYEGFGLPPLEAMAYELPVLAANASCLPEVLEDSALYFNPNSQNDLLASLEIVITDQSLRAKLKAKGLEQIKKYSWDKMAKEIIEVYQQVK